MILCLVNAACFSLAVFSLTRVVDKASCGFNQSIHRSRDQEMTSCHWHKDTKIFGVSRDNLDSGHWLMDLWNPFAQSHGVILQQVVASVQASDVVSFSTTVLVIATLAIVQDLRP